MRELVLAMRAIWASWADGSRLAYRGEFYRHTLMTPMFSPGPNPFGNPKVFIAAVGPRMTEVAGEVADGVIVHGFTTERYLREITLPALERGLVAGRKSRADVEISYPGMVVTGIDEAGWRAATKAVKAQLAFYGSTPAYKPVLDLHGWGDLQVDLNTLSKRGEWAQMAELIDDDMLHTFAVVAPLDELPAKILGRFGDLVDRFSFYAPYRARGRAVAVAAGRGSNDQVHQPRRPADDPGRRPPGEGGADGRVGEGQGAGLLGGDRRRHLETGPHLAVDLHDHRHRLLDQQLRIGHRPRAGVDVVAVAAFPGLGGDMRRHGRQQQQQGVDGVGDHVRVRTVARRRGRAG